MEEASINSCPEGTLCLSSLHSLRAQWPWKGTSPCQHVLILLDSPNHTNPSLRGVLSGQQKEFHSLPSALPTHLANICYLLSQGDFIASKENNCFT